MTPKLTVVRCPQRRQGDLFAGAGRAAAAATHHPAAASEWAGLEDPQQGGGAPTRPGARQRLWVQHTATGQETA